MISLYREDHLEDLDTEWPQLDLWNDASIETADCFFSSHQLPTEQELLEMEADQDESYRDDSFLQRERRTALRH